MATFWEIAARSVNNMFSLYFVYLYYLFIFCFGFKSGICLLIAPVPVHCFSITLIRLLLFTCNYVVSVWRGFLFFWVLGMGYVLLLWHSLSLPYNYLVFTNGMITYLIIPRKRKALNACKRNVMLGVCI